MGYMVNSSKSISSVFIAKWVGVTQKTAWKMCHAVREMIDPGTESQPALEGIVELDEKYFGGKPRPKVGVRYKRGKGTSKQDILIAVERQGPVRSALFTSGKTSHLFPFVDQFVQKETNLMTDENYAYRKIGLQYNAHFWVKHSMGEFARGDVHNNTAESFSALLERAKEGIFHYLSKKHLTRYLNEIGFRWDHRIPIEKVTKKGTKKTVMIPIPVMGRLQSLLTRAAGRQLRQTINGGILRTRPAYVVNN